MAHIPPTSFHQCPPITPDPSSPEPGFREIASVRNREGHNDGDWVAGVVPRAALECPQAREAVHVISEQSDSKLVAVSKCNLRQIKPTIPIQIRGLGLCDVEEEKRMYDRKGSTNRPILRLRDAREGIAKHGAGLVRFYKRHVPDSRQRALLEWWIFCHDLAASRPDTQRRFSEHCLFVCATLAPESEGDGLDILRTLQLRTLHKHLQNLWDMATLVENVVVSDCQLALLRGLLECAGGSVDSVQRSLETGSINENLTSLGHLFGAKFEPSTPFRGFPENILLDVGALHTIIGFREDLHGIFPQVANILQYKSVIWVGEKIHKAYENRDLEKNSENDALLFVCYSLICGSTITEWTASPHGEEWYKRVSQSLGETAKWEQMVVRATACRVFDFFSGRCTEDQAMAAYEDFTQELAARERRKRLRRIIEGYGGGDWVMVDRLSPP